MFEREIVYLCKRESACACFIENVFGKLVLKAVGMCVRVCACVSE